MATTPAHGEDYDLIEKLTRINQLNADINLKQQQQRFAPWQLIFTGIATGAGLLAAGGALVKLMAG